MNFQQIARRVHHIKENNNASGLNPSGNAYLFDTLCASKTNPDIVFVRR